MSCSKEQNNQNYGTIEWIINLYNFSENKFDQILWSKEGLFASLNFGKRESEIVRGGIENPVTWEKCASNRKEESIPNIKLNRKKQTKFNYLCDLNVLRNDGIEEYFLRKLYNFHKSIRTSENGMFFFLFLFWYVLQYEILRSSPLF